MFCSWYVLYVMCMCIQNNIKTWYQFQNCLTIIYKVMTIILFFDCFNWSIAIVILPDRLIPSKTCLVWCQHPCCSPCLSCEFGLLQIYWSLGFILSQLVDARGRQGSCLIGWINGAKMHIFNTCFMRVIDFVYVLMALFYVPVRFMHVMVQLVNVYGQP